MFGEDTDGAASIPTVLIASKTQFNLSGPTFVWSNSLISHASLCICICSGLNFMSFRITCTVGLITCEIYAMISSHDQLNSVWLCLKWLSVWSVSSEVWARSERNLHEMSSLQVELGRLLSLNHIRGSMRSSLCKKLFSLLKMHYFSFFFLAKGKMYMSFRLVLCVRILVLVSLDDLHCFKRNGVSYLVWFFWMVT